MQELEVRMDDENVTAYMIMLIRLITSAEIQVMKATVRPLLLLLSSHKETTSPWKALLLLLIVLMVDDDDLLRCLLQQGVPGRTWSVDLSTAVHRFVISRDT